MAQRRRAGIGFCAKCKSVVWDQMNMETPYLIETAQRSYKDDVMNVDEVGALA